MANKEFSEGLGGGSEKSAAQNLREKGFYIKGRLSQFGRITKDEKDCDGLSPTVMVLME